MIINLEGLPGVGKTTLGKELARLYPQSYWVPEPDELSGNPYLQRYYEDPKRWALTLQLHMLALRVAAQHEATRHSWQGRVCILDRSIVGDAAFAQANYEVGNMTADELRTYLTLYLSFAAGFSGVRVYVHLHVDPEVALARVQGRMVESPTRKCETGLTLEYMRALDAATAATVSRATGLVLDVDWNEDRDAEGITEAARGIMTRIQKHLRGNACW